MFSKIKNILIFVVIGGGVAWGYFAFLKPGPAEPNLLTTGSEPAPVSSEAPGISNEFLGVLLNVKNIRLDDSIFSDSAFLTLRDSSITLIQDVAEGRPNPFAPIGAEGGGTPLPTPAPSGGLFPTEAQQ